MPPLVKRIGCAVFSFISILVCPCCMELTVSIKNITTTICFNSKNFGVGYEFSKDYMMLNENSESLDIFFMCFFQNGCYCCI